MAKTVSEKRKRQNKSEANLSTEKINRKSKKRRKTESVSSSSDSGDDNKTPSKVNNTSRKSVPSSDSDSDTPQQPQKITTPKTPLKSTNLMDLFRDANELSEVSIKSPQILTDLADSDVYLVQIPKNLHPQLLTNALISLDEKVKLQVGKSSYVWDSSEQKQITLNLTEFHKKGRGVIKRLNCQRIIVHNQFKWKQFPNELQEQYETVPFPLDLKPHHHQLYGAEYADKIKLDDGVKQKINSARQQQVKAEKKVKRKKRTSNLQDESYDYEQMFSSQNDFSVVINEENDFNFEVKKKKKKKELD